MPSFSSLTCCVALVLLMAFQGEAMEIRRGLEKRQQQQAGTPLFLDEPACDFYQCSITYYPGDKATAHWTDAPSGNVVLDMMTNNSADLAFHIANVPGVTSGCDTEGQSTCGQFDWIIPSEWVGGNYSLRAMSEDDSSVQSYTDVILVLANPNSTASVALTLLDPTTSGGTATSASSTSAAASSTASTTSNTLTSTPATVATSATSTPATTSQASTSTQASGAARLSEVHTALLLLACTLVFAVSYL